MQRKCLQRFDEASAGTQQTCVLTSLEISRNSRGASARYQAPNRWLGRANTLKTASATRIHYAAPEQSSDGICHPKFTLREFGKLKVLNQL